MIYKIEKYHDVSRVRIVNGEARLRTWKCVRALTQLWPTGTSKTLYVSVGRRTGRLQRKLSYASLSSWNVTRFGATASVVRVSVNWEVIQVTDLPRAIETLISRTFLEQ